MSKNTSVRKERLEMPAADDKGWIPTLNRKGWMHVDVTGPAADFVAHSAKHAGWSLDIGCAYGAQTIAALQAGARVVANDIDKRHLQILQNAVASELSLNLRTRVGSFPAIRLPANAFGSILASNVMHFLDGPTLERAISRMFSLLQSNGKVFIKVISPYNTPFLEKFTPQYERRKAAGEKWPGVVQDMREVLGPAERGDQVIGLTHYLEPSILAPAFEAVGFRIDQAEFASGKTVKDETSERRFTYLTATKP
jgi:SAM-dependent methyltransferase